MATLRGTPGHDTLRGGVGDDQLFGLAGADVLYGGGGADEIRGGAGNDSLLGGSGNDTLLGNAGADQLRGGAGADHLNGGPGADWLLGGPGSDVLTGGAGADRFVFTAAGQGLDRITDFHPEQGDTLRLTGALAGASVRMVDDGTSTTVKVHTAAANAFTDLAVLEGHREPIDVWYGDHQSFGDPGAAQRWVNVLGTVATAGLGSLSYTLDGGPEHALAVGPNGNRLQGPGDFNVELDYRQLDPSAVDDVVTLKATYGNGEIFTRDIAIDYEGGHQWPTSYSIDWAKVTDLQDVVQVVDGLWSFDASGARPAVEGYDRVLTFGDTAWDNYAVRFSFTPHDLSNVATGGAIWFGMQWGGHTDNPFGGSPHVGYVPGATFMLNGPGVLLRPSEFFPDADGDGIVLNPAVGRALPIAEEHSYNVLIRNEHVATDHDLSDGLDRTYSLKVWEAGTPEPAGWLIQQTMLDQEPFGAFYLNAHFIDVTFGDVDVIRLPGNALLASADALPTLLATDSGAAAEAGPAAASESGGASDNGIAPIPALADLVIGGDQVGAA